MGRKDAIAALILLIAACGVAWMLGYNEGIAAERRHNQPVLIEYREQ